MREYHLPISSSEDVRNPAFSTTVQCSLGLSEGMVGPVAHSAAGDFALKRTPFLFLLFLSLQNVWSAPFGSGTQCYFVPGERMSGPFGSPAVKREVIPDIRSP